MGGLRSTQKKNDMKPIKTMKFSRDMAAIGAALTGIAVIWSAVYYRLLEMFGQSLGIIGSLIIVLGVLALVDFGFRQYLPYGLNLLFSGKWRSSKKVTAFVIILMLVCLVQASVSIMISWSGRQDMIEAAMPEPDLVDITQAKIQLDQAASSKITSIDRDIVSLQRQIAATKQKVRDQNKKSVSIIENGQDTWSWHAKHLDEQIRQATKSLEAKITSLRDKKTELINKDTELTQNALMSAQSINQSKMNFYTAKKNRNQAFLGYFGVGCTLLMIIFSTLLALADVFEHEAPTYRSDQPDNMFSMKKTRLAPTTPPVMQRVNAGQSNRETMYLDSKLREYKKELDKLRQELSKRDKNTQTAVVQTEQKARQTTSKPLADKKSTKKQAPVQTEYIDLTRLKDNTNKQWLRSTISATNEARSRNAKKAEIGIQQLESLGIKVERTPAKLIYS